MIVSTESETALAKQITGEVVPDTMQTGLTEIKLRYFASLRERLGIDDEAITPRWRRYGRRAAALAAGPRRALV